MENESRKTVEKPEYISKEERKKCQKVAEAYAEMCEQEGIVVVDAGGYGYVKLDYYFPGQGFDAATTFTDSQTLFEELWGDWLYEQVYPLVEGTPMADMDYEDVLKYLPEEKQKEIAGQRTCLAQAAGIEL